MLRQMLRDVVPSWREARDALILSAILAGIFAFMGVVFGVPALLLSWLTGWPAEVLFLLLLAVAVVVVWALDARERAHTREG